MLEPGIIAFVTLFAVLDPLGNVPVFVALCAGQDERQRRRSANQAVLVALLVILAFAFAGQALLRYLDIPLESLTVSGGALLGLTAFQMMAGQLDNPDVAAGANPALVPLASPMLAGPGAIAATMVLMDTYDDVRDTSLVIGGVVLAAAVVWVALRLAIPIGRRLSTGVIHLMTRVIGLILAALAVQLVFEGVRDWNRLYG